MMERRDRMEKRVILMVGPCGSGKSTIAKRYITKGYVYINQDAQGRDHLRLFEEAIKNGKNTIVDRMGFTKQQRSRYTDLAKQHGYTTTIKVLHESYETCLSRCLAREGHETIKDIEAAKGALNMFFSKYERVEDDEADSVERYWPQSDKPMAVICDLDGTLCNIEHRLHFVQRPKGTKKDWKGFFDGMDNDEPNRWCADFVRFYASKYTIVYCSGRPDDRRRQTNEWLKKHNLLFPSYEGANYLFMRNRADHRQDNIAKEIILDFEILTRFTPYLMVDDREQVVKMWRKRGYTCLQCAEGNF